MAAMEVYSKNPTKRCKSLRFLLHSSRGVLLKCGIGNLEAAQGIDANIQDRKEQEGSHESHENTWKRVSIANRGVGLLDTYLE